MSRTIPEALALVKQAMQSAYDSAVADARRYAAENPDDVSGISYKYDLAQEFLQGVYYAADAEEDVLGTGENPDDAVLGRLIASVAASDAGADKIEGVVCDLASDLVQAHDEKLADARRRALHVLTIS